jgi:23S rRNA pseudouridine1911/1915/1917 synthase
MNRCLDNLSEESGLIFITDEEAGERLDKILAHRFREVYSRTYFQSLIEGERILVNGSPVKKRMKPEAGDEVEVEFLITPELKLKPEAIPLSILYEDEALIVINKPAGLVVHPAVGNWTGTLVNALLYHCQNHFPRECEEGSLRPGIVHRLDKETSGVLVAAKTPFVQQKLIALFASRAVFKEYVAICLGNPGSAHIKAPIGRHLIQRKKMAVLERGGKEALTHCQTIAFDGTLSLVKVVLTTGRTHQIRVHMQHLGTPILGDALYGHAGANKKYKASRQLLHSWHLQFCHPLTGDNMLFEAPIPDDMKCYIKGDLR